MEIKTINELTKKLISIPTITKKQAEKLSDYILKAPKEEISNTLEFILEAKDKIGFCEKCNFIVENGKCVNCDRFNLWNTLIIVESVASVKKIFDTDFYNGYFYVLPYLLSVVPKDAKIDFNYEHLVKFIKLKRINEVIIVLSPTIEGQMTTAQLMQICSEIDVKATKAAVGLPLNSNIEYIDEFTIKQAIENRTK
ncbi:toprim domain-containing protein [Mycoplasmopsis bovis]|uniref:toprim domain-containing protein n=1 Tax=Mycoplasmopsis bovis TaxID=28903 RepID=UPI003CFECB50